MKYLIGVVATAVLSVVFFLFFAIMLEAIAALIFGTRANGSANVNGSFMLIVTILVTMIFGSVCFQSIVNGGK